jgi:hypothetical protein
MPQTIHFNVLILGMTLLTTASMAQDHLEPEKGILAEADDYQHLVRTVFSKLDEEKPVLKVVVLPSFQNELFIGLKKNENSYQVFTAKPSQRLWLTHLRKEQEQRLTISEQALTELRQRTPLAAQEITVQKQNAELSVQMAERIEAVWKKALLDVQHPKKSISGNDGDTYHFSMFILGRGTLSGQIWTPMDDSRMKKLVGLVEAMNQHALEKGNTDAIDSALKALE